MNRSARTPALIALMLWLGLQLPGLCSAAEEARLLEQKLQQQLEAVVGPGKARVIVSGESQSDALQQRRIERSNPRLLGEQTQNSHQNQNGNSTTRSSQQRSWTFDQTETLRQQAPGGLQQKSIAIIYEPPAACEEDQANAFSLEDLEALVRTAANLDESRGDRLSIKAVRLAPPALREALGPEGPPLWLIMALALGSSGLGAGLMFVWLRRRQRRQAAQAPTQWEQSWPEPALPAMRQPVTGELISEAAGQHPQSPRI
ncbi:MAG: hypothetical protein IGS03_12780 [Candidatus Sericytochromatia bacterium]|nr:hypothetical protein [Candidatus Sericytochromatia bacterium]